MEELQDVEERGPDDRVTADAHAGGLADARVRHSLHGLIGERAGTGNDPGAARLVDAARNDA